MALYDDISGSRYLRSSISSLSASRQQSSQIAKAYRQAAQLFLTRRLPEALSTIEPIISANNDADADDNNNNNNDDNDNSDNNNANNTNNTNNTPAYAPVATASRGTRVKVWSFYLTFLNSVVELGADEGKHAFGSARWKQLVATCRDGSVWDAVVRDGYAGVEGDVDADVVVNLSTLLLTHSPSQRLNQARLEAYLAATAHPTFDMSHLAASAAAPRRPSYTRTGTGTDTPRDLTTRIKLLELYTLHVLPRNDEWDYAREFIAMSELLDDDRKEAFLLALHSLREEKDDAELREEKLRQQQRQQLEDRRRESEAKRLDQLRLDQLRDTHRTPDTHRAPDTHKTLDTHKTPDTHKKHPNTHKTLPDRDTKPTPTSRVPAKKPSAPPPPGIYHRLARRLAAIHAALAHSARHLATNPLAFLRTLLFLAALALAFGRRNLRERVLRVLAQAMDKVRRTVGMGVKVSYI